MYRDSGVEQSGRISTENPSTKPRHANLRALRKVCTKHEKKLLNGVVNPGKLCPLLFLSHLDKLIN